MPSSRNYRLVKALSEKMGLAALAEMEAQAVKSRPIPTRLLARLTEENPLSSRQREIMVLVASGLSTQEIADELGVTYETIKHHIRLIFKKLGAHNRIEAINIFLEDEA